MQASKLTVRNGRKSKALHFVFSHQRSADFCSMLPRAFDFRPLYDDVLTTLAVF